MASDVFGQIILTRALPAMVLAKAVQRDTIQPNDKTLRALVGIA
jgi:hypothetical protein